jgi:predicted nuclease with TOPRIM domain
MVLADLAPQRDARAVEQEALTTRLRQLEAEMERLTAAVAEGGELPTLLAALKGREGQRVECRRRLEALGEGVHPLDLRRAERRIRERLRDATRLLERQLGPARGVLRELLSDRIAFTPHVESERR